MINLYHQIIDFVKFGLFVIPGIIIGILIILFGIIEMIYNCYKYRQIYDLNKEYITPITDYILECAEEKLEKPCMLIDLLLYTFLIINFI